MMCPFVIAYLGDMPWILILTVISWLVGVQFSPNAELLMGKSGAEKHHKSSIKLELINWPGRFFQNEMPLAGSKTA